MTKVRASFAELTLDITQGTPLRKQVTVKVGGAPVDLTGVTFLPARAKRTLNTEQVAFEAMVVLLDAPNGVYEIRIEASTISSVNPGKYVMDIMPVILTEPVHHLRLTLNIGRSTVP